MTRKLGLEVLSNILNQASVFPHPGNNVLVIITDIARIFVKRWSTDGYEVADKNLLLVFVTSNERDIFADERMLAKMCVYLSQLNSEATDFDLIVSTARALNDAIR